MIQQTAFIIYDIYNQGDEDVSIDLTIGYGQIGASILNLDSQIIGEYQNSFSTILGRNKQLAKKILNIYCTIQDIQPETNKIFLGLKIAGGKKDHIQTIIDSTVSDHGQIASALVTIVFI